LFKHGVKRWTVLLLFAAGIVFVWGRGRDWADPARHERDAGGDSGGSNLAPPPAAAAGARGGAQAASHLPPPAAAAGTVVRIRDGDSIVVMRGGVGIEVRLDGIDCPELAQAFGKKARRFTADLAFGKEVRLVGKGRDRYDRELAEVFLPDGRSLNRELVAAGCAWWYRKYSNDRTVEALEREARAARRGLWAAPNPVPPWDFRTAGRR